MSAKIKVRRHMTYTVETDEGREFEVRLEPVQHLDPVIKILPDGRAVVGYLCQDSAVNDPLEDCDGMGKIGDARRDASREANERYREALGLDQYGYEHEDFEPDPLAVLLDVYSHSGNVGESVRRRWLSYRHRMHRHTA